VIGIKGLLECICNILPVFVCRWDIQILYFLFIYLLQIYNLLHSLQ
jgi:hypothetical protein